MSKKASARYSKIFRRVWIDEKVRRLSAPKPNAQTLWFRLLSGPELTNIPGLIVSGAASLAEALGWETEDLRTAFTEIEREGLAVADWSARLVWVPNAIKYNEPDNPNVIKSWAAAWEELPECDLKERARAALRAHLIAKGKAWLDAFDSAIGPSASDLNEKGSDNPSRKGSDNPSRKASDNPSANRCRNQEQEQEQEQDLPPTPLAGGGAGESVQRRDDGRATETTTSATGHAVTDDAPSVSTRSTPMERFVASTTTTSADRKLEVEVAKAFDRGWKSVNGTALGTAIRGDRLAPLLAWARDTDPSDPIGVVERAAKAFAESPDSRGEYANMPFAKFCSQPGKYVRAASSAASDSERASLERELARVNALFSAERDPDRQLELQREARSIRYALQKLEPGEPSRGAAA